MAIMFWVKQVFALFHPIILRRVYEQLQTSPHHILFHQILFSELWVAFQYCTVPWVFRTTTIYANDIFPFHVTCAIFLFIIFGDRHELWCSLLCNAFSKAKVLPVHTMEVYWGNRGLDPFILNLGTMWRWVFNSMPRPLYWRTRTQLQTGWVGPIGSPDVLEKIDFSCPFRDSNCEQSSP